MAFALRLSRINSQKIAIIISSLAVFGTLLEISSFMWDAASHIVQEPDRFWTIQHISVYSGVGMVVSSAIIGLIFLVRTENPKISKGIKLVILGAALQIAAGYADSVSHAIFGIDGVVSIPHAILESAPALSAFGSLLILNHTRGQTAQRLTHVAVLTLIFSVASIIFNLSLLFAGVILCTGIYQIFSFGCAIL